MLDGLNSIGHESYTNTSMYVVATLMGDVSLLQAPGAATEPDHSTEGRATTLVEGVFCWFGKQGSFTFLLHAHLLGQRHGIAAVQEYRWQRLVHTGHYGGYPREVCC